MSIAPQKTGGGMKGGARPHAQLRSLVAVKRMLGLRLSW